MRKTRTQVAGRVDGEARRPAQGESDEHDQCADHQGVEALGKGCGANKEEAEYQNGCADDLADKVVQVGPDGRYGAEA